MRSALAIQAALISTKPLKKSHAAIFANDIPSSHRTVSCLCIDGLGCLFTHAKRLGPERAAVESANVRANGCSAIEGAI